MTYYQHLASSWFCTSLRYSEAIYTYISSCQSCLHPYYSCLATSITIMRFTLCFNSCDLKEPLWVRTCVCVCEVECVGLNGAEVDPVCPELAWLSTLLCPLKLKIGLGLQALSLYTAHCRSTAPDNFGFSPYQHTLY